MNGIVEPGDTLFTSRKSPTSSVSLIDPDVMTKLANRKVRKKNSITAARVSERVQPTNHARLNRGGAGGRFVS